MAETTSWKDGFAGACSGAMSRTVLAPVERVKLVKQLELGNLSALQVASKLYRQEGALAFWRGNLPSALRVSGTATINFACMNYYKQIAHKTVQMENQRFKQMLISFVSGGLAGFTATTALYPIEFVRTRLALDRGKSEQRQFKGSRDVMTKIFRSDGLVGFYQGWGVAVTGGVIYRIILLGGYDALKNEFHYTNNKELNWGERIVVAQSVSLTGSTVSYPFDSVRRRMMMQVGASTKKYKSSLHCIRSIWQTEGWRGFFLGLGPNVVRSVSGALLLIGYDRIRSLL